MLTQLLNTVLGMGFSTSLKSFSSEALTSLLYALSIRRGEAQEQSCKGKESSTGSLESRVPEGSQSSQQAWEPVSDQHMEKHQSNRERWLWYWRTVAGTPVVEVRTSPFSDLRWGSPLTSWPFHSLKRKPEMPSKVPFHTNILKWEAVYITLLLASLDFHMLHYQVIDC